MRLCCCTLEFAYLLNLIRVGLSKLEEEKVPTCIWEIYTFLIFFESVAKSLLNANLVVFECGLCWEMYSFIFNFIYTYSTK